MTFTIADINKAVEACKRDQKSWDYAVYNGKTWEYLTAEECVKRKIKDPFTGELIVL